MEKKIEKKTIEIKQGAKGLEIPPSVFDVLEPLGFVKSTTNTLDDIKLPFLKSIERIVQYELFHLGEIDFSSQKAILEKVDPNARKQFDEFLKRYPRENQALPGSVVRELQSLLAGKISVGDVSFFHQSEFNNKQESAKESRRFKNHREIQYSLGALKGIEKIESLRKAFPVDILPQLDELLSLAFGVGELAEKLASTFSFGLAKTVEEAIKARRVGTGKEVVRKTSLMNWVMNTVEKVNREKKIAKEISRAALAVRVLGKWPVGKKALKKAGLKDFDKKPVKKTIENHLKKLGYYRDLARVSRI